MCDCREIRHGIDEAKEFFTEMIDRINKESKAKRSPKRRETSGIGISEFPTRSSSVESLEEIDGFPPI